MIGDKLTNDQKFRIFKYVLIVVIILSLIYIGSTNHSRLEALPKLVDNSLKTAPKIDDISAVLNQLKDQTYTNPEVLFKDSTLAKFNNGDLLVEQYDLNSTKAGQFFIPSFPDLLSIAPSQQKLFLYSNDNQSYTYIDVQARNLSKVQKLVELVDSQTGSPVWVFVENNTLQMSDPKLINFYQIPFVLNIFEPVEFTQKDNKSQVVFKYKDTQNRDRQTTLEYSSGVLKIVK